MTKTYSILDTCGAWWEDAIKNVIAEMNATLGTHYTFADDWRTIDKLAYVTGMRFDINGEIVKHDIGV